MFKKGSTWNHKNVSEVRNHSKNQRETLDVNNVFVELTNSTDG